MVSSDCDADDSPDPAFHRVDSQPSEISRLLKDSLLTNLPTLASPAAHEENPFSHIGEGQCGTVYALAGTAWVVKISKPVKRDELYNDRCKHNRVEEVFKRLHPKQRPMINIPGFGGWMGHAVDHTAVSLSVEVEKGYGLSSTRIPPVSDSVRKLLFNRFAPANILRSSDAFLRELQNNDVLIRLYLGRRQKRSDSPNFKLRNFDLMLNEMESLGLPTESYATMMARALAILHFGVRIDADDVEFVLAGPGENLGDLQMWLLDFNQCRDFPVDNKGVMQLVDAFFFNDPYYPRPPDKDYSGWSFLWGRAFGYGARDRKLWETFKNTYLITSGMFNDVDKKMAVDFIREVEYRAANQVSLFS